MTVWRLLRDEKVRAEMDRLSPKASGDVTDNQEKKAP
jgi:hypothetical protein